MFIMKIPVVFPKKIEWLALFLMIGIFGFIAQVLLTLGLQRETAGRGTMAIYIQVSPDARSRPYAEPPRDYICYDSGGDILPHDAFGPFHPRDGHHHDFSDLHCGMYSQLQVSLFDPDQVLGHERKGAETDIDSVR